MAKFIKLTEKYCGKTFDPVIYINVDGINWYRNIPTSNGERETWVRIAGMGSSFAVRETIEEIINLINE